MILEIGSTIVMGGIAGYSYLKTHGSTTNDGEKIQRIFANAKWDVKENGLTKTVKIVRRRKIKGGKEYVLQLPLGMSSKEIIEKKHVLEDGLNVKSKYIDLQPSDLLDVKWDKTIIKQIKELVKQRKTSRKELDIDFDGMLRIRVYDNPLSEEVVWDDDMLSKGLMVPVGYDRKGIIYHDFDALYSLIVAGTPGFGKSQFLKMIIACLTMMKPKDVTFTLIDLKEGASFKRFENLKQTERFAVNPDEAKEVLEQTQKAMNEMYRRFINKGFESVKEAGIKSRHFIMVDEGADIAQDKECIALLTDIARRGRAAGFYLVYSTQYPTARTIPMDVKRNIPTRLSFVLDSATASVAVLDQGGAEDLPMIEGRAIYKHVRCRTVQTPYMNNQQIKERIQPHIEIKSRKDVPYGQKDTKEAKSGKHSILIEKV